MAYRGADRIADLEEDLFWEYKKRDQAKRGYTRMMQDVTSDEQKKKNEEALKQMQDIYNQKPSTNGTSASNQLGGLQYRPYGYGTCPACGHCPHCGRGGQQYDPYRPYWGQYLGTLSY